MRSEIAVTPSSELSLSSARWLVFCCLCAAVAYSPILNNGFIADDYVILRRIEILKTQPLYLYQVPPENFRSVSYAIFGLLKAFAGYHAWAFYAFNVGVHLANIVLLFRFLRIVLEDELTIRLAVLLFAVFQAPQEAVMWLAAMNETTLFFFTILTLILWVRKRHAAAALTYSLALFSKESGILIPLFIVLLELYMGRQILWRKYLFLIIPSIGFAGIFLFTISKNFMLANRSYALGWDAIWVLGKSLHRLLWPWFYIFLILAWVKTRRAPSLSRVACYLAGVIVAMLPYMFIAYQTSLPSRQLYLASAVLMTLFATLLRPLHRTPVLPVALLAFVIFNVGYLWLRKDAQFEERAAPTTQLVTVLGQHRPQKTVLKNFAYPYPEIATSAVLAVPGWDAGLISVGERETQCTECLQLEWNSQTRQYESTAR
jgi:hypothetical protein